MKTHQPQVIQSITVMQVLHIFYQFSCLSLNPLDQLNIFSKVWVPVKQCVEYKLCMMVHRCLYGDAPSYLADLIMPSAAATVRPGLRSAASSSVAVPRTISSLGDRSFVAGHCKRYRTTGPHRARRRGIDRRPCGTFLQLIR